MESVLWYMLTGARGGPNRIRILQALQTRPWNAHQLAEELELDYTTVRYHLDVLMDHALVTNSGGSYGTVYELTDAVEEHWAVVERIVEAVDET